MVNPAAGPTGGGTRRLTIPGAATLLLPAALGISVARAATKRLFGSTIPVQLRMSALRVVGGTALAAATLASIPVSAAATSGRAAPTQGGSLGATGDSPAVAYSAAVTQICAGALLFDNAHQMGTRVRRALDRRRHPSLDRPTPRPRHRRFRPTRAPEHQQPLDRFRTPTRGALRDNLGPHLRHHRRHPHTSTTSHSPETAREAHPCTRHTEASRTAPRARPPRPRLHRRRLVNRPVPSTSRLGVPSARSTPPGWGSCSSI